jgi:hypothetical protein
MIGILIAVVVVVGVAVAADLLLSFAVIRRLAALQERIKTGGAGGPQIGHRVGDFRVELITGGVFTRADLSGSHVIVAFLMTTCEPCKKVVAELRQLPDPPPFPLHVLIVGAEKDYPDVLSLAAAVPPGARVGRVSPEDGTGEAFGIDGYPTVLAIEDGTVRAAGLGLSSVLEHAGTR